MDFTLKTFQQILQSFLHNNYQFLPFKDYLEKYSTTQQLNNSTHQLIILRHDVDRLPQNALQTAVIEHDMGIQGTYYFRIVPESFNLSIMEKIVNLGHEIGYHYEDVDLVIRNKNLIRNSSLVPRHSSLVTGNSSLVPEQLIDAAYESFCKNLERMRKHFDIKTICMHGSPLSRFDNRDLWKKYDYRTEGIIGEPYLDINWDEVFYLTDTGRRWDGEDISIRDKIQNSKLKTSNRWPVYNSTGDIVAAIENGSFPKKTMMTTHPQRWTNNPIVWTRELIFQYMKNTAKKVLVSKSRK